MSDQEHGKELAGSKPRKRQSRLGQLRLLMWKNMILRKRHWLLTFLELAIPTGLMCLVIFLRTIPDSKILPEEHSEITIFDPASENDLRGRLCVKSLGIWYNGKCFFDDQGLLPGDRKLFWGPPTNFTEEMIEIIKEEIFFPDEDITTVTSIDEMDDLVDVAYLESNSSIAFYIGIFFNLDEDDEGLEPPIHLNYDLRLQKVWFTEYVYPFLQIPGPRNYTDEDDLAATYNLDGFTILQTIIDRAFMKIVSGNITLTDNYFLETQMYPYPPYVQDHGLSQFFGSLLPTFVVFSLILLSPTLIKSIVYEKETGVREMIKMMGLEGWLIWIGWFLYSFLTIFFVCIIIMALLKIELVSRDGSGVIIPPVLVYSDGSLVLVFLVIYGISAICFCFAISCFFSKPTLATTIGVLLWILTYFIPRTLIDYRYDELGLGAKLSSCLLPNMAMTLAFRVIAMFEGRALGIHWDNLWDTGNPRDQLTPGMILIMLVVDIILYTFITWYVDQVLPGVYGVAQPWYFLFQKSYWKRKSKSIATEESLLNSKPELDPQGFMEEDPAGLTPGIVIKGLRKEFKTLNQTKVAVKDVSFNCYKGQCTVLLGHNGAGKTTTMSVLTGVYAPTSGYAEINGWNITTNLKEARGEVGLCPQHNTLFTDLSVKEHLLFFGRLKGLTPKEAKKETKALLERLKLEDKKNQFGGALSGGMKRKLCLAIALIGGSNVIILDEPSSGLDPESRRWVWNVVQQERGSRTVLVTTHHMEEADVLGDRVAIMANGKVVCCGSSLFLKNKFGDGYTLTIAGQKETEVSLLEEAVLSHFEDASLSTINGYYYEFKIPPNTENFPALLNYLTEEKARLNITHIGLSLTTMEQVFLSVGNLIDSENNPELKSETEGNLNESFEPEEGTENEIAKQESNSQSSFSGIYRDQKLKGKALLFQRFRALWKKKFIYSRRKWLLIITQALIPVMVTILCLEVDSTFNEQDFKEPSVELNIDMFDFSYSSLECRNNLDDLCQSYSDLFEDPYKVEPTNNITKSLLQAADDNLNEYRENYVTSALFKEGSRDDVTTRMLYQSIPYHTPGIGINLIDNALLHHLIGSNYSITTNNAPLPLSKEWQIDDDQTTYSAALYSTVMPLALSFLTSSFLVFPLQERISNSKQIQLMTGTPSSLLWATTYIWDLLTYIISSLLIFGCFMGLDSKEYFTSEGAPGALIMLLIFYGIGSIPMAYVFSFPFLSAASGFAVLAFVNIVTGVIISTVTLALDVIGKDNLIHVSDIIGNITAFVPSYPVSKGFLGIVDLSNYNKICDVIEPSLKDDLCNNLNFYRINSTYLICCPDYCEEYGECFMKMSYTQWEYPGIGMYIVYLIVDCFLYFIVLFFIEIGAADQISIKTWELIRKIWPVEWDERPEADDDDVERERRIAHELFTAEDQTETAIVVKDLTKAFIKSGTVAVKSVSFSVKKGECFGLLGVNGAGKTTTFRMLTGDEVRSSGDARIGANMLSHGRKKFMEEIGYCPQFDAIIGELTGKEMLSLMAGLRGVAKRKQPELLDKLIHLVDLTECAMRPSYTYSGGNKRKLSTAMALVGQPPLVFLDEPTSGVDPASRRRVWEAIRDANRCGQSVILTSHSMDECESLCSNVVIMAKGVLRCAGTPKHLKSKFGNGYTLQVKITSSLPKELPKSSSFEEEETQYNQLQLQLKEMIFKTFPGAVLADHHRGMLSFRVPSSTSWSFIFTKMEALKSEREALKGTDVLQSQRPLYPLLLEDYAAMDPSLEQVFLSFAREDEKPHKRSNKIQETKF